MHTKGTWHVLRQGKEIQGEGGHEVSVIIHGILVSICELPVESINSTSEPMGIDKAYHVGIRESLSNAHLIAASPELLEACKYVVRYHRENDSGEGELFGLDFVTTCINAIRKAGSNI